MIRLPLLCGASSVGSLARREYAGGSFLGVAVSSFGLCECWGAGGGRVVSVRIFGEHHTLRVWTAYVLGFSPADRDTGKTCTYTECMFSP